MDSTTVHSTTDLSSSDQLGRALSLQLRRCWHDGEQVLAEHFLSRHPEVWQQPEVAVDLIYEEYCLRQRAGQTDVEQDILRRFPQWAQPLRVMLDCHRRLLQSEGDLPHFPGVGERVGDFNLLAELARGSRGRVFLAAQRALADRPVVLKITPLDGREHLSMARLQHTNIAPLYSVLDDPKRCIRVLCMPYFGLATLASLFQSLNGVPTTMWTGQSIVDVIERKQEPSSPAPAIEGAARQMLARVTYAQAMCWISACLADALQFAHERGLVHLDLKPSNVLLATDGQPMLLDFHLAREPIQPGCVLPEHFGGTPPYMPPEQQSALSALRQGLPSPVAVDARADLYAMGAILYESLGGRLPITPQSPPLATLSPLVTQGLSDIVARCIESRPEHRYPDAQALADDLRRHLTDQPLVGVPNRNLAERWSKWRRRRPSTLRIAGTFVLLAGALFFVVASLVSGTHHRHEQAQSALFDGQRQLQDAQHSTEAARSFERGLALIDGRAFQGELRQQLRDQLAVARRMELAGQLHRLADEIRVLYGTDAIPPDRLRSLAAQTLAFWNKRDEIMNALTVAPDSHVAADLQDIAIFAAGLQVRLATSPESNIERRNDALRILNEAQAAFGPTAALSVERQMQLAALGSTSPETMDTSPAAGTAWEHYAVGRAWMAAGDLPRAARELAEAVKLDPTGVWPNFSHGLCAYKMGRHDDAIAAFSVCIGGGPDVAGFFYNRALAYSALGRQDSALVDYNSALRLDPTHASAALNRGVLHYHQGRLDQAVTDLELALQLGADAATAHYDLALTHLSANHPALAMQHAESALERDPTHSSAQRLRDSLQQKSGAWK